jgi:hypothetical protein
MGWLELKAWYAVVRRQREGPPPDPGSFTDQASQRNFAELDEQRRRLRGR